jgi:cytochrome b561
MAAQAEHWHFLPHTCSRERMLGALFGCIALLAVAVGVLGLLGSSWLRQMLDSWINVHALFGLLLCGLVSARYRWCVIHSPRMLPADIRQLSRHLSRVVYLSIYLVIGVREIIGILNSVWHGGVGDLNLFDERFHNGPGLAWNPKDDFQLLFASGLFALIFVRVLACKLWLRSRERAAVSKAPTEIVLEERVKEFGAREPVALAEAQEIAALEDARVHTPIRDIEVNGFEARST